ncbi:MAG: glutathione-dependent disulfide-bond oxidoreductase [Candidatus Cloacimonetes bacterium]|nr:glutathione-dependent disulfide-bond oxidoreductase [Candidatus Cloacimonadota bacterium]
MTEQYNPPKVWQYTEENGGKFSNINRPTAGSRVQKELPSGHHPFQLYSLGTPNGVKVTILFEELLELGLTDAEYDAFLIDIGEGDQFTSGFVNINPNSKIPALVDKNNGDPISVFESGAILLYLAEKFDQFIPHDQAQRAKMMSWLFWQMGSTPYLGGGFGHFYAYAPQKFKYPLDRFTMETKRQLDVLDKHLANHKYIIGSQYTIADMAIFPWYGILVKGRLYDAAEFLSVHQYENITRWADLILSRPAVLRGQLVNCTWGNEDQQLKERHNSQDFDHLNLNF